MRSWILPSLVVLELAAAAFLLAGKSPRPTPPVPNLSRLDEVTAAELRELARQTDRSPEDWRKLGEAYLAFGYFPEAEACYAHASQLQPGTFAIEFGWAYALQRLGRVTDALDRFRSAAEIAPPEMVATCWYHVGRCQLRRDDPKGAAEAFAKIPGFPPADFLLARILHRSGRHEEALALLNPLRKKVPSQIHPVLLRSSIHRALGDEVAAWADRELSERTPDPLKLSDHHEFLGPIRARHGLSRITFEAARLRGEGQSEQAAARLREAIPLADLSNRVKLMAALAELEIRLRRADEALRILDDLFETVSPLPEMLSLYGDALAMNNQFDEAAKHWQRALAMRPTAELHQRLAEYYRQKSDEDQIRKHMARALCCQAVDLFRQNELPAARHALQKAVELDPEHPRSWFYLGECCRAMGLEGHAQEAYARCLNLDPAHSRAQAGLSRLENR